MRDERHRNRPAQLPFIRAVRVADLLQGIVVSDGVKTVPCCLCDRLVMLSPSSQDLVRAKAARPACRQCVDETAKEAGGALLVVTPAAAAELLQYRRAQAERN